MACGFKYFRKIIQMCFNMLIRILLTIGVVVLITSCKAEDNYSVEDKELVGNFIRNNMRKMSAFSPEKDRKKLEEAIAKIGEIKLGKCEDYNNEVLSGMLSLVATMESNFLGLLDLSRLACNRKAIEYLLENHYPQNVNNLMTDSGVGVQLSWGFTRGWYRRNYLQCLKIHLSF